MNMHDRMDFIKSNKRGKKRYLASQSRNQVLKDAPSDVIKLPLFEGMGTHYAFLYIGTPKKQRISVIVDTGSHHTAFPCVGCNCGQVKYFRLFK